MPVTMQSCKMTMMTKTETKATTPRAPMTTLWNAKVRHFYYTDVQSAG